MPRVVAVSSLSVLVSSDAAGPSSETLLEQALKQVERQTTKARKQAKGTAAKVAKHSVAQGLTVREAVVDLGFVERGEITEQQLDELLDVLSMTSPGL